MKLIIQIPCYNEEDNLGITLRDLPRTVEGFDTVEWLVINDGSTDQTLKVAHDYCVDHVVNFTKNHGLAQAFVAGLNASLKLGADVIVNTDADNQYHAQDISKLVQPILAGKADMVIGARSIDIIEYFSPTKKILQRLGSWVVRVASKADVADATSGFRAISRDAAMRLNVFTDYTYTLETIIQAGHKNISIVSVPVRTNAELRPSRLLKSTLSYVINSINAIVRIFVVYQPFRFFMTIGVISFTMGFIIGLRFLWFWSHGHGSGYVQSLILASILLGVGFQTMLVAFLADLQSVNRKLLEDIQYRFKIMDYPVRRNNP